MPAGLETPDELSAPVASAGLAQSKALCLAAETYLKRALPVREKSLIEKSSLKIIRQPTSPDFEKIRDFKHFKIVT